MTFETKEEAAAAVPPAKEEKPVNYRRCQRKLHCQGAKATSQFWDGMEPLMVCPACQTEAERRLVQYGPFADAEPPLHVEETSE